MAILAMPQLALARTLANSAIATGHEPCTGLTAAPEPVTIERGNTADLADLAEMRGLLDCWDWPQTPAGLSEALKMADKAEEYDKAHAKAYTEVRSLRAEVAALKPGPWVQTAEERPPKNEYLFCMWEGSSSLGLCQLLTDSLPGALTHWRRIPVALRTLPEKT